MIPPKALLKIVSYSRILKLNYVPNWSIDLRNFILYELIKYLNSKSISQKNMIIFRSRTWQQITLIFFNTIVGNWSSKQIKNYWWDNILNSQLKLSKWSLKISWKQIFLYKIHLWPQETLLLILLLLITHLPPTFPLTNDFLFNTF
jgi:hypothetical protein